MASLGSGMLYDSNVSTTVNSVTTVYTVPSGKIFIGQIFRSSNTGALHIQVAGVELVSPSGVTNGETFFGIVLGGGQSITWSGGSGEFATISGVLYRNP